ncbi:MAG: bifunctional FO biosynthesis protein CofGH, partial [Nocardioidaceae bacterium]|nr:bifunctional FO biosynthesis protein CofGH [Nocardioidaceae bacterium]
MIPSASALRRVLRRAKDGVSLNLAEITVLLQARSDDLDQLCTHAARMRDAGLLAAGRPRVVTFSPKVFLPLTRLCRDRCHYCTFALSPAGLGRVGVSPFMSADDVIDIARRGAELGCKEALFTLGDRPEDRWPEAREWLAERGYSDTLSYVRAMSILVLEETGLLPHLNPGVMTWSDLQRLKPVAPSMGMMLETSSTRLFTEKGEAHYGSPDKDPAVRLRVLEDAGRLSIPFTTGILVGIGETYEERAQSLLAIRGIARQYGAIQEVIVQNFRAKDQTPMRAVPDTGLQEFRATVAVARLVLGPSMRIQAPPNLVNIDECALLLGAGVDDWGGVSPVTPDHVNPERPWPAIDRLREVTESAGFTLAERLAVQPEFIRRGEPWIDPRVWRHVVALAQPDTGLADLSKKALGLPWQEPDQIHEAFGRVDLHAEIDETGRKTDRRGDFSDVYGDWDALREANDRLPSLPSERLGGDVLAALRQASIEPSALSDNQALTLLLSEGVALDALCSLADAVRRDTVGDDVTYVVNRNINFTNVCYVGCRFCAFAQRRDDADAYSLSLQQVGERVVEAWSVGATEICMQGGISPDLSANAYFDLARQVKQSAPDIHLHAFSPMEVMNG